MGGCSGWLQREFLVFFESQVHFLKAMASLGFSHEARDLYRLLDKEPLGSSRAKARRRGDAVNWAGHFWGVRKLRLRVASKREKGHHVEPETGSFGGIDSFCESPAFVCQNPFLPLVLCEKGASIRSGGFLAPPAFTSCNSSGLKMGTGSNPSFAFWQPFCWKHRWALLVSLISNRWVPLV